MRKEISPEMYNYNKFPGPQFVAFPDRIKSEMIELFILENTKDALDVTVFSQRFSDILLKYDYIVGDWGNDQLRLKGFYKDDRDVKKSRCISHLEDYLKEYCNFGCAYFVLENKALRKEKADERRKGKSSRHSKRSASASKEMNDKGRERSHHKSFTKKHHSDKKQKPLTERQTKKEVTSTSHHFVISKKKR